MVDIFIDGGTVVTMDSERRIIRDGAVVIDEGKIISVGKREDLSKEYKGKSNFVINGKNKLILPGFIDAHVHTCQTLPKGLADDVDAAKWLSQVLPFELRMTKEDAYYSVQLACMLMIKTGTTCFMEACATPWLVDTVGKAVKDIGIRGVLTRATMDYSPTGEGGVFSNFLESTEDAIKENLRMIEKWNNVADGRIRAWFSFRHLFSTSDELLREIASLAKKYGVGIHAHAAWHQPHIELVKKRTGGYDEIEHLYNLGVLDSNVLLAHVLYVNEKDIELLRKTSTNVVHCPTSNMKSAYGMTIYSKIPEMIHSGVNVCLGCDGTATNNNLDIISEMKISTISHKDCRQAPTLMPAEVMLEMATINGAKALMWDNEIGSIETGKKADLIIVNMKNPKWIPRHNPISNIVYSATGDDVETVIIDGKLVMYKRELLTVNEEEILEKAQKTAEKIMNEENLAPQLLWKVI